jgi:hypothetical protein
LTRIYDFNAIQYRTSSMAVGFRCLALLPGKETAITVCLKGCLVEDRVEEKVDVKKVRKRSAGTTLSWKYGKAPRHANRAVRNANIERRTDFSTRCLQHAPAIQYTRSIPRERRRKFFMMWGVACVTLRRTGAVLRVVAREVALRVFLLTDSLPFAHLILRPIFFCPRISVAHPFLVRNVGPFTSLRMSRFIATG